MMMKIMMISLHQQHTLQLHNGLLQVHPHLQDGQVHPHLQEGQVHPHLKDGQVHPHLQEGQVHPHLLLHKKNGD